MCDQLYLAIAIAAIIIAIWYILMHNKSSYTGETEGDKVNAVLKNVLYNAGKLSSDLIDRATGR